MRKEYQHQVKDVEKPINVVFFDVEVDGVVTYQYEVTGPADALVTLIGPNYKYIPDEMFDIKISTGTDSDELPIETIIAICSVRFTNMKLGNPAKDNCNQVVYSSKPE